MSDNVVRFCDFDKRSKQPDAEQPRDPCEADVIACPIVRFPHREPPIEVLVGPLVYVPENQRD